MFNTITLLLVPWGATLMQGWGDYSVPASKCKSKFCNCLQLRALKSIPYISDKASRILYLTLPEKTLILVKSHC